MVIGSILLGAYALDIIYVLKYRKEMLDFINNEYVKLAEKIGTSVDMMVNLNSYKKFSVLDLIPIFNIYYQKNNLKNLMDCYEENKEKLCKNFPVIEKQYKLEEQAKNNSFENNEDKNYFIGVFEDGRPINIFFTFNGREVVILEGTHSSIIELCEDDAYLHLFYLLYCYYYGGEGINASINIGEVYNDAMLTSLHDLFDDEINKEEMEIEVKDDIIKLTRKK